MPYDPTKLLTAVALGVGLFTTGCRIYGREATIQPNMRYPPQVLIVLYFIRSLT
jgi:hypothetical protein